jgi:large conductance mechanosensitive channel
MVTKGTRRMKNFWQDFKKFITKGDVIDMAVGVVIGGAFSKIVSGLVNYIINPCVALLTSGHSLDAIKTVIKAAEYGSDGTVLSPEVAILWGSFIQAVIDFLIVSFCIFIVLRILIRAKNFLEADRIKKEAEEKRVLEEKAALEKEEAKRIQQELEKRQRAIEDSQLESARLLSQIRDLLDKHNKM